MRVAVIGARRHREGTGPFLAAFFARSGAEVRALLGTSERTAEKAAEDLRRATRQEARPYHEAQALFEAEDLDALVIASPHQTHVEFLELALLHDLHVLCEKPLVWGGTDPLSEATRLALAFSEAGLTLRVNAQWPETLPTYRLLYPETPDVPATFEMHMAPTSGGIDMLVDSLPHPLSMLSALAPDPGARIEAPEVRLEDDTCSLRFDYVTDLGEIECRVVLTRTARRPRPAAYGLDGNMAHRRAKLAPYELAFEGGGRTVPLPDPTPLLVRSFLADAASSGPATIDFAALPGMAHLVTLVEAATHAPQRPTP